MDQARETGISKMAIAVKPGETPGRDDTLGISLLLSVAIHICVILVGSAIFHSNQLQRQEFLPIGLVDLPGPQTPSPPKRVEAPPELKKPPPPPPPRTEKPKETRQVIKKAIKPEAKVEIAKPEPPPLPAPAKEEPVTEVKSPPPAPTEASTSFPSDSRVEGGGSEAGAGKLFDGGDVGVIPGAGTSGGGGGTASSGLGRGSGAPGLPAQSGPIRTNRQAKPIETARASYPPMALRAGLESDVTLKIEVDTEGRVTKAEITKSGGSGFDEEALKAVKQSRFEPARQNGQLVPTEFIYVYRFR
ncbi:MAG: energy transducer TonB, partial [Candidatus Binatia bacterium]